MGLVQREIDKIRNALVSGSKNRDELYAAQQALEWAIEPGGIKSPYAMITGTQEGLEDCLEQSNPVSSEYAFGAPAG